MLHLYVMLVATAANSANCHWRWGRDTIEYRTYPELVEEERRSAANEFRQPDLSGIPVGGLVVATIERTTIGAASGEYFEIVVTSGQDTVGRFRGGDSIANVPNHEGYWWNIVIARPEATGVLTVHLVDSLFDDRCSVVVNTSTGTVVPIGSNAPSAYVPSRRPQPQPAPRPEPVAAPHLGGCTYVVQAGDTWAQVATWHGVGPGALMTANPAQGVAIEPGATLRIPRQTCPADPSLSATGAEP